MALKQENRMLAIATALGPNVLGVRTISVQEQLSRLFQIELELSSEDGNINFDEVVGHGATVRLDIGEKDTRYFNGIVSRLVQGANQGGYAHYQMTLMPWLWLLTRTAECRVWVAAEEPSKGKTVPEVIEAVFQAHGFSDYKLDGLSGTYPKVEFCVQYRETAFNFVSRLMEQEGIYYYFEHENGKHTLVLADSISAHKPFPGYKDITFHELTKGAEGREVITDWVAEQEVQPVAYALNDFDFKKPKGDLRASKDVTRRHGEAKFEIYDYPGEYLEHGEGDQLAQARLDELQSQHEVLRGRASARGLAAGCTFKLKGHPRDDQNREYLITGISLRADAGEFASTGGAAEGGQFFTCSFVAIDKAQQFRPARLTPKPVVQGPQTAIVVGPDGEDIYTDSHARVKVHFHWDREKPFDENASCWVRVSQEWAGRSWGSIHIPRIGQEVIVDFLEGDPDEPIITGRVYNGEQVPPYELPDNKTQSGIKSRSTKGGGGGNFNELRFEDKKGGEEVFLHGEKDWTIKIKNNEHETVGVNISTDAGANISRNAGGNISRTADVTITDKAGKDIITKSGKNMDLEAGGSYQLFTNLGIHLKAMNFVAALIESGAKAAAQALVKGGAAGAKEGSGAPGKAEAAAKAGGAAAVAAFGPAVAAVTADLSARQAQAEKNMGKASEHGAAAGKAAAELQQAVSSGASNEAIAGAVMALAGACYDTYKDAQQLIEDMLPQIPSIVLWAMKDINGTALWSMTFQTKVKDISLVAQNKDINVQAKQNVNVEAKTKNVSIKAGKKVSIEAGEEISIKTGDASITMKKDGSITLQGKDLVLKGSGKIGLKADSDITVKGSKVDVN